MTTELDSLAESAVEIQAARLMTIDAAKRLDQGDEARVEIALIKFWGGEHVAQRGGSSHSGAWCARSD